jgi:mono/diheme cytochrome c family protein
MAEILFYGAGGVLIVIALLLSFAGLRSKDFPSSGAMRGLIALMGVVVVATAIGAVLVARDEQQHRREEMSELAAEEAAEAEQENLDTDAEETAGEAAPEEGGDGQQGGGGGELDGGAIFVEVGCGSCHSLQALGGEAVGEVGPNLDTNLENRDAEYIRTAIVDPAATVAEGFSPGIMPEDYEQQLSPEELDALVSYLERVAGSPPGN